MIPSSHKTIVFIQRAEMSIDFEFGYAEAIMVGYLTCEDRE
jgi:hypothetical protein